MNPAELIDLTHPPAAIVTPPPEGTPDRMTRFHAALDWLIERGEGFVLITIAGAEQEESPEDKKARALWMKANVGRLAAVCRGFIYVEPDAARRAAWEQRAILMAKSFPIPMHFAGDLEAALIQAARL